VIVFKEVIEARRVDSVMAKIGLWCKVSLVGVSATLEILVIDTDQEVLQEATINHGAKLPGKPLLNDEIHQPAVRHRTFSNIVVQLLI
jgi:hypothetical protein